MPAYYKTVETLSGEVNIMVNKKVRFSKKELATEIWKDVVGFEGKYKISNLGRLHKLSRIVYKKEVNKKGEKIVLCRVKEAIYYNISHAILNGKNRSKHKSIASIVLTSFVDKKPPNLNHIIAINKDGNKFNNRLSNLKWGTIDEFWAIKLKNDGMGKATLSMIGKVFGDLTVIKEMSRGRFNHRRVKCVCSCGKEVIRYVSNLLDRQKAKTCSCGCKKPVPIRQKRGVSSLKYLYGLYKRSARVRGLGFDITIVDFDILIHKPCHYCGRTDVNYINHKSLYGDIKYNGLDRVDNSNGYSINNVVPCCGMCNIMKHSHSYDTFLSQIKLIYETLDLSGVSPK